MTNVQARPQVEVPGKADVLQTLGELMEIDTPLTGSEALSSFDQWDSLTVISFIAYADERFGKVISGDKITQAVTVNDLVALVV